MPKWRAVRDDKGRIVIAICHNSDVGDAWEWADSPDYPERATSMAYRIAINYIIYGMTHWARDSVHASSVLLQAGAAHEEFVDAGGGFAAFGDGPDDQRLAAAHVAGGEDSWDRAHVVRVRGDIAARVEIDAELLDHSALHRAR